MSKQQKKIFYFYLFLWRINLKNKKKLKNELCVHSLKNKNKMENNIK